MATKIDKPVKNFLIDFGLTDKEITVYLTLLKTGPNTIMNLARETGIKRSTTHNTVEELIKKGLVSQTNYGERRMVVAEDPKKLEFLMEQKRWDMKKLEDNMPDIVKAIYDTVPTAKENSQVEVRYYTGEKGFKEVCQRSLDYAESEILFISNLNEWRKVYTDEYDQNHYIPTRLKKNISLRMLAVETDLTSDVKRHDKEQLRATKFIDKSFQFASTIIIYKNEVSIMVSSEPYTAILIEGPEIYNTFKSLFEVMWQTGK